MNSKMLVLLAGLALSMAHAETITVQVLDSEGGPVADAAVYAKPVAAMAAQAKPQPIIIDQIDKEFIKHLTVVQTGTAVSFPNHDKIRHHVYSFSAAKVFELPLYAGIPPEPVVFDKVGAVALGCNIHDWMSAYIYVVDSPYFAVTDQAGRAQLNVPASGGYVIGAWHRHLKGLQPRQPKINVAAGGTAELALTMQLKRKSRPIRLPAGSGLAIGYR